MIKKINLLITCVGGEYGPELVSRFKKNKFLKRINIIGTDTKSSNEVAASKFVDNFFKVPEVNKKSYFRTIDQIIKKKKINLILAC